MAVADLGLVVAINYYSVTCCSDAFLVERDQIRSISLPMLTVESLEEHTLGLQGLADSRMPKLLK